MSYTDIKKEAKQAFETALSASDTGFSADFKTIQIIPELSEVTSLKSRRIVIGAGAVPRIAGAVVLGWDIDLTVQVITNFNKWTKAEHESFCGPVEALIFTADLPTRMSNSSLTVQVSTPGSSDDDFEEDERITEYHVMLDCLLTGV